MSTRHGMRRRWFVLGLAIVVASGIGALAIYSAVRAPATLASLAGSWTARDPLTAARVDLKLVSDGTYEERLSDYRKLPQAYRTAFPPRVQSGDWRIDEGHVFLSEYLVLQWSYGEDWDSGTGVFKALEDWRLRIDRGIVARWDALEVEEGMRFTRAQ